MTIAELATVIVPAAITAAMLAHLLCERSNLREARRHIHPAE